jgi:hypothetical protein
MKGTDMVGFQQNFTYSQVQWYLCLIPATQEVEMGGSQMKAKTKQKFKT